MDHTRQLLLREILRTAESRYCHRLHALLLIASGKSRCEVGRILGRSPRTVQSWARRFDEGGLDGLREGDRLGRNATLDEQTQDRLAENLLLPPAQFGLEATQWSGGALRTHLSEQYGVSLGLRQCQRLLRSLALRKNR